jgi:malic enzyme
LKSVIRGADVFLGLSAPGVLDREDVEKMRKDPIVFAMANPVPEVSPEDVGDIVAVMATGRSDYPNQINNVLAFPGIFRGALDARASQINASMTRAAAEAIAAGALGAEERETEVADTLRRSDRRDDFRVGVEFDAPLGGVVLRDLTPQAINTAVAQAWGVTVAEMRSKNRQRHIAEPRQVAMYFQKELLDLSYTQIGQDFGGRDHSTVIHSIQRVTERLETDPLFRSKVEGVRGQFR